MDDLVVLDAPKHVSWPSNSDIGHFIDIYDWDQIVIEANSTHVFSTRLTLCSGIMPCIVSIRGNEGGKLQRTENGCIACLSTVGCTSLSIMDTVMECKGDLKMSIFPAIEIEGANLNIQGSSFIGCASLSDGGSIKVYNGAIVQIDTSMFQNSHSEGSGGAISVIGGSITISESIFLNCSSAVGGGAIVAADFFCYGSLESVITSVDIKSCTFEGCSSDGSGGAILVKSKSSTATISRSEFLLCYCKNSGGAISSFDGANVSVKDSSFLNNSAAGLGGGALFSHFSVLLLHAIYCSGNTALAGGGGAIFWQGVVSPRIIPWCDAGSYPSPKFVCNPSICTADCVPCKRGWFGSVVGAIDASGCSTCEAGKYSSAEGATFCLDCEKGTYSEFGGATSISSCAYCDVGKYSSALALSTCFYCPGGSYSSSLGSTYCDSCDAGKYFLGTGANQSDACIACGAGFYSEAGTAICSGCDPGSYSLAGSQYCTTCQGGSYSNRYGSPSCYTCPNGSYSGNAAAECNLCMAGTYSNTYMATSEEACISCPEGKFSEVGYRQCYSIEHFRCSDPSDMPQDGSNKAFQIPFSFPFYCSTYNSTLVYPHGIIEFAEMGNSVLGDPIHNLRIPNLKGTYIAVFWQFLGRRDDSLLLEWQSEVEKTIQWRDWRIKEFEDSSVSFQLSLFRNGSIILSYISLEGPGRTGDFVTIGIESNGEGIEISHNNQRVYNRLCIHLFPDQNQCNLYHFEEYKCPESISLAPSCPAGKYMGNNLKCTLCEHGKYQTGYGMTSKESCAACQAGKYSTASGATAGNVCISCNSSLYTVSEAVASCSTQANMSTQGAELLPENMSEDLIFFGTEVNGSSIGLVDESRLHFPGNKVPVPSVMAESAFITPPMEVTSAQGGDARLTLAHVSHFC
jgi:hypothetical protein